jgi:hypothetical protein
MSEEQTPFIVQTRLLDGFIRSENPQQDPVGLGVVLSVLREKPELRQYFFRSHPSSAWAEVLWDHGFLSEPLKPSWKEEKLRFPYWDAQEYLISVAKDAPEVAINHIFALEGYSWYRGRALLAIQFLADEMIERIMSRVLPWLEDREFVSVASDSCYSLMLGLAQRKNRYALDLFRLITAPVPSTSAKTVSGYVMNAEAVSLLPDFRWDGELETVFALLREMDAARFVGILEDHLCLALRLEAEAKQSSEYEYRLSSWWRKAIESTSQDLAHDYKEVVLEGLRDTLEFLGRHDNSQLADILKRYARSPYEILRRLRLHVLSLFAVDFKSEVTEELLSVEKYDETGIHHEFFMLLKRGFPVLTPECRGRATKIIVDGPPKPNVDRFIKWIGEEEINDKDLVVANYIKRWVRDRLAMISQELDESGHLQLKNLIAEVGEPEHPDFTSWTSPAFFVSDVSPLSNEQLAVMSSSELLTFLTQWRPDRTGGFSPEVISYRGLGKSVAEVIERNAIKYGEQFVAIGLLGPEFSYALLGEQRLNGETARKISESEWTLYLDLCEAILADEKLAKDMTRESDINWRDVRAAMITLIESALEIWSEQKTEMSFGYFARAREILIQLTNDPDPISEARSPAKKSSLDDDPATSALNHVRPKALGALIDKYAYHFATTKSEKNSSETEGPGPPRLEPKVLDVLGLRLNRLQERNLAVHSVYGRDLIFLYWLDKNWVELHLADIFPEGDDGDSVARFVAAWDSYVVFNKPRYKDLFELLYPRYRRAIDNLSKGLVTRTHLQPDQSLAAHVLGSYLFSEGDKQLPQSESSLFTQFFAKAPADTRGSAIWILWNTLKKEQLDLERLWPRVREIWRWRIDEASSTNHSSAFDSEMSWFPHLLEYAPQTESLTSMWPLLEGVLPYLNRKRFRSEWEHLLKYLLREIKREPLKAIRFYRLMHEVSGRPLWFRENSEQALLELGLKSSESRSATLSLIDLITSLGDLRYRELYEKYAR